MRKTMYYWSDTNFGDELNRLLFNQLFNANLEYSTNPWKCDLFGIGSILSWACVIPTKRIDKVLYLAKILFRKKSKITILGSGYLKDPEPSIKYSRKMDFRIVRGRKTEKFIREKFKIDDILLGDLGILSSYLLNDKNEKKYELGIVPHYLDLNSPAVFELYKKYKQNCTIINVQDDPLHVIKQISSCEKILSSSLHGLVVADSFGIPNLWFENKLKSKYKELDHYKYQDYYSIYDIIPKPIDILELLDCDISIIERNYKVDYNLVKMKQNELYNYCLGFFNLQ